MFKKMLLTLALVVAMVIPAMASDLYDNGYYYEDEAVKGGYVQGMLPIQGVAVNGAIAYGEFGMSADFAALQALPMAQAMAGVGNGGFMTSYHNWSNQTNLYLDVAIAKGEEYAYAYVYPHNYYYNPTYAQAYDYYYGEGGDALAIAATLQYNKYEYDNSSLTMSLPSVLETSAFQAGSNSITFEAPGMKLKMDQSGVQAGSLKVLGYGSARGGQTCN